ncbi:MAG TPA: hypothetical protein VHE30_05115 [Polyangiaceae bacterium]|nr:hypothetical protein [Polyangiaceae bacterium]
MSVTIEDVLNAVRAHAASVTGETAGYLVLGVADRLAGSPGRFAAAVAHLAEDGSVSMADVADGTPDELESDLRALLGAFLGCSRGATPALLRIARTAEPRGLGHLVAELEAALIPVNRSAGRRALSRVHRDTARARAAGKLAPPVASAELAPIPIVVAQADEPSLPDVVRNATRGAAASMPSPSAEPSSDGRAAGVPAPEVRAVPYPASPRAAVPPAGARLMLSPPAPPAELLPEPTPVIAIEPVPADRQVLSAEPIEPEATPFLGAWPGAAPPVTALREPPEHDTQLLPPVLPFWALELESGRATSSEPRFAPVPEAAPERPPPPAPGPPEPVIESTAPFAVVAPPIVPLAPRIVGPARETAEPAVPAVSAASAGESESAEMDALSRMESRESCAEVDEFASLSCEPVRIVSRTLAEPSAGEAGSVARAEASFVEPSADEPAGAAPAEAILEMLFADEAAGLPPAGAILEGPSAEEAAGQAPAEAILEGPSAEEAAGAAPGEAILEGPSAEEAAGQARADAILSEPSTDDEAARAASVQAIPEEPVVHESMRERQEDSAPVTEPPPVEASPEAEAVAPSPPLPVVSPTYVPRKSDVSELLQTFAVAEARSLREISRDLKNLAGIAGTPYPPAVVEKR